MIKTIELGDVTEVYDITLSDYTDFFGEVDGCSYPYIEFDHDPGYTCGRCNGPCDRDCPPSTNVSVVIWKPDDDNSTQNHPGS